MTFFLQTFGCQMNVNDSERMRSLLMGAGLVEVSDPALARVVIVNSCAVRSKPQEKVLSWVGRLPVDTRVVVTGCSAQIERDTLRRKQKRIRAVLGTHQYARIGEVVASLLAEEGVPAQVGFTREWQEIVPSAEARESRITAYLTIMEGCDNFCTYCVVPFTRSREKFRPVDQILAEAREIHAQGFQELVLLGQNVNHWEGPQGMGFPELLARVAEEAPVPWIRFVTSYPGYHDERLIQVVAEHPRVARHIHFPAQSGSTRILRAMGRRYTRTDYLSIIRAWRRAIPGMEFSSDFIVGFPGETDHDHALTLSLLEQVRYTSVFSFVYSPRPHTRAAALPDTRPLAEKKAQLQALQALQARIQLEDGQSLVGREVRVLVTGPHPKRPEESLGRLENLRVVNLDRSVPVGSWVTARVVRVSPHAVAATVVSTSRG